MPQLDKISFFSQFFWSSLLLIFGYFVILRFVLPYLFSTLKFRRMRLEALSKGKALSVVDDTSLSVLKFPIPIFLDLVNPSSYCEVLYFFNRKFINKNYFTSLWHLYLFSNRSLIRESSSPVSIYFFSTTPLFFLFSNKSIFNRFYKNLFFYFCSSRIGFLPLFLVVVHLYSNSVYLDLLRSVGINSYSYTQTYQYIFGNSVLNNNLIKNLIKTMFNIFKFLSFFFTIYIFRFFINEDLLLAFSSSFFFLIFWFRILNYMNVFHKEELVKLKFEFNHLFTIRLMKFNTYFYFYQTIFILNRFYKALTFSVFLFFQFSLKERNYFSPSKEIFNDFLHKMNFTKIFSKQLVDLTISNFLLSSEIQSKFDR